jgi:excisionase family DNA binding protein
MTPAFLTIRNVSDFTGYSRYLIRSQIKSGKLRAIKIGRTYLIELMNLRIWLLHRKGVLNYGN